jgi:hypothetical protein
MKIAKATWFFSAVGLTFIALTVSATPITYNFTVTALSGQLAGVSSTGTLTYDSNNQGTAAGLLTALNFTWHGITYGSTTANTGSLILGIFGQPLIIVFGNNCAPGGCTVNSGIEEWYVSGPNQGMSGFIYSLPGGSIGGGTATFALAGMPSVASQVPAVSQPATLALLSLGLFGVALARRR